MLEPDVTLTDYALTLECLAFCTVLARPTPGRRIRAIAIALFAALGMASFLGGTVHGFFPGPEGTAYAVLWRGTLLAIGLVALFGWCAGARLLWTKGKCLAAIVT